MSINRNLIQNFPFHLVEISPWPLLVSFTLLNMAIGGVMYMHGYPYGGAILSLGFALTASAMALWFKDIVAEATYLGCHTTQVQKGLTIGVVLFIISEVFAFLSVFWAFFHSSLSPAIEIGGVWPPQGITALDPFAIPLLNTILLLSSGAFVTYGHHALIQGNREGAILGTLLTIVLAVIFTCLQYYEYSEAAFTFSDSVYGSAFYASTGLHGFHVIIGTIFIAVAFIRLINYHLTNSHHQGFEAAILYWHMVDVIWLFLFIAVYYWGGGSTDIGLTTPEVAGLSSLFCVVKGRKYPIVQGMKRNFSSNETPNTGFFNQMLIGLILGDGTLVKKYKNGNTYFQFAQSIIHKEYVNHVFDIFKNQNYCHLTSMPEKDAVFKGKVYKYFSFSTKSLPEFNALYTLFYPEGTKVIPATIGDLLTPVSLAYWVMDDGGKCVPGFHINTNGFTLPHVQFLADVLSEKFNLKCSVHGRNRIYIWAKSVPHFESLVKPYIIPSMVYKLTETPE